MFGFWFWPASSAGTASALDAGKGRLGRGGSRGRESRGVGALHVAAGRGRIDGFVRIHVYMVEELLVDVNASDDSGGFFFGYPSFFPVWSQQNPHVVTSLDRVDGTVASHVKFDMMILQKYHIFTSC